MNIKQIKIQKDIMSRLLLMIMIGLIFLAPSMMEAAQFFVWGRVYSAGVVPEGEDAPPNPISGVPVSQVIGDDLYALTPRNLVKVRVLSAINGSELGSYPVLNDGGYLVSFNAGVNTINVKFVVEELATSKILLESTEVTLSNWTGVNIYYLLIQEGLTEIGDDREFAKCPIPGKHTGIFTRVGKIEVATEIGGVTHRLISPTNGLVNVPDVVADQLKIHAYQDAPLGGNLYMFGAFSQLLYSVGGVYYRVKIDDLDKGTSEYLDDPLVKTKYTVNLNTLSVKTDRITLGPQTVGLTPNCYQLTPLSTGIGNIQTYWSFPDLLALWRTGARNGKYRLTLEVVGIPPANFVKIPTYTDLKVHLDNTAPQALILPIDESATGTILAKDSPLMYSPPPVVPIPYNLGAMLGVLANYGPDTDPKCAILKFKNPNQHLVFKLTANHGNGFMRYWYFSFKRNDTGYQNIIGKYYDGVTNTMKDYSGLKITTCTESGVKGFKNKHLYLTPGHLDLGLQDGCAYRFFIEAATRATDGYNYLRWARDEDMHYVEQK